MRSVQHESADVCYTERISISNEFAMIGLSFDRCVSDILNGMVFEHLVKKIITRLPNGQDSMERAVDGLMRGAWHSFSRKEVDELLARLVFEHPRVEDRDRYPINDPQFERWVDEEWQIKWSK